MSEAATIAANPARVASDHPTWELYSRCIHCGLCLNACPTYRVLGLEMDSPRGRIYQVTQVEAGRLGVEKSFVTHIDRCLDCRACETACPSGVEYGRIVERARAVIEAEYRRPWLARRLRQYFFNRVLVDFKRLARWARWLRFYQRSGLQRLARASGILKLVGMSAAEALAPAVDDNFFFAELGKTFPARGERRGRVALLAGCVASVTFAELNRATVRVLQANGVEVIIPAEQGCCGALQAHAGFRPQARALARQNIRALLAPAVDAILTNAAGCGSAMKEYWDLLEHDPEFAARAREFSGKVKDVTEYLAGLGLRPPQKKVSARITYQDACHLAHGQRVRSAPRELLRALGCELVEMPLSEQCCGSAGSYNLTQTELSMQILDRKMENVERVQPEIIATANPGCTLQLRVGCRRSGLQAQVKHVVELLDAGYS